MTVIASTDLASYLGVELNPQLELITTLTNGIIEDSWLEPTTPIPARVTALAYTVAARALTNPRGLSSWTLSWDDVTRTERASEAQRVGVFLTEDELATLNPQPAATVRKARSIRLHVPGWS